MKPRPKPKYLAAEHSGQREVWMVSYADFVTILLILFIAIAAQGMHPPRPPQPARSAQPSPQPQAVQLPPKPEPVESHEALVRANALLRSQGIDSRMEARGLVISLPQAILFPSGEDHVLPAALPIVSEIAQVLASVPNKVALVGHADSVPIHNKRFHSNWELSAARSLNLLEILRARYGISESRLSVQSYGTNDPKDSNETAAGRAENRRVEILLLDETTE